MFAHDMKNPVITARGFLSRLITGKAGQINETQRNYLEILRDDLDKLEALIKDFLDFSKFERKEYKPVPTHFNITEAISKIIENMMEEAEEKDIYSAGNF